MAKNNRNKKKSRPGYFEQNIREFGEDFLEKKTAKDIDRDAQRVFKDIAFRSPDDMINIAPYFQNRTFLNNLANSANDAYFEKYAIYSGVNMFVTTPNNPLINNPYYDINRTLTKVKGEYEAYAIITRYLNNIVSVMNSGNDGVWINTMIIDNLRSLSATLKPYRYSI